MLENFSLTSLAFIPILGFLIFVHELGHFLAARWMGVRVREFGFGYPPRMVKLFERNGVEYTLNWLPLGGFVRMAGEEDDFEAEGSLAMTAPWRRIIVLAAGPIMNMLAAVLVMAVMFMVGVPGLTADQNSLPVSVIGVAAGSPAELAGIQIDDKIRSVGGVEVSMGTVAKALQERAGQEIAVVLERDGSTLTVNLTPRLPADTPEGQGATGVTIAADVSSAETTVTRARPVEALVSGAQWTANATVMMVDGLGDLFRALISPSEPMPEGGVGGIVAIGRMAAASARSGLADALFFTALFSINLALLNMLPIPALDGGRIVFALVEMVRRKRIPPEREALVHFAGFVLLLGLMLLVTVVDIQNWIAGKPLPGG